MARRTSHIPREEYARKAFHLLGLCIPLAYYLLPEAVFRHCFFAIAAAFMVVDLARLRIKPLQGVYLSVGGRLLRQKEQCHVTGSFYFFLGSLLTVVLFAKQTAMGAILVLTLSDAAASLAGQSFGRHRIGDKTIEGSAAFFASSWLLLSVYHGGGPLKHVVPALAGTLAEFLSSFVGIDDNVTIPLAVGFSYAVLF